jgi:hypothetical protein
MYYHGNWLEELNKTMKALLQEGRYAAEMVTSGEKKSEVLTFQSTRSG